MKLREEELNQLKHDVLANPHTFNQVWAEKYNVSRERIRQLRVEMGLPGVKDFNPVSASKVISLAASTTKLPFAVAVRLLESTSM